MNKTKQIIKKVDDFLDEKNIQVNYAFFFKIPTFTPTQKEIDYLLDKTEIDPLIINNLRLIKSQSIYGLMVKFEISRTRATEWFNMWFFNQQESTEKSYLKLREHVENHFWNDYNE